MIARFVSIFVATLFLSYATAAVAQSHPESPHIVCRLYLADGSHRVYVAGPFALGSAQGVRYPDEELLRDYQAHELKPASPTCLRETSLEAAQALVERYLSQGGIRYRDDWHPTGMTLATAPNSATRALTLDFEPGDGSGFRHARRGYKRASIKLNYRFLLCADEIQVAYALDRKSLEHSQDYVDKFVGTNPNVITPPGEPPVPMTVPLALKVYLKKPGSPYVATLRDDTAGEALGMGCFTGQTSKIGLVATLIGPKATRPEIKSYLDLLDLSGMTTAAEIDTPLLNPAVPVPLSAPRPTVRRKAP